MTTMPRGALRVLALARRELPPRSAPYTAENVERDLTFLGLMAMMDPPRPEVEQAIEVCRQAGIRIAMITGDYGLTAESIARRVGMISTPNPIILTGAELDAMNDARAETRSWRKKFCLPAWLPNTNCGWFLHSRPAAMSWPSPATASMMRRRCARPTWAFQWASLARMLPRRPPTSF